jgi:hypothetical protein
MLRLQACVVAVLVCSAIALPFVDESDFVGGGPSGAYSGETSVLGMKVTAKINCKSATKMDIVMAGPADVDCKEQTYSIGAGGVAILPREYDGCLYDAIEKFSLTDLQITYDATSDSADVTFKVLGALSVALNLKHDGIAALSPLVPTESSHVKFSPSGTYVGTKSVLGVSVTATIKIDNASTMDFSISGAASINCPGEAYSLSSSGTVELPTDRDSCIYNALAKQKLSDLKAQYDAAGDAITVTVKEEKIVKITFVMKHTSLSSMADDLCHAKYTTQKACDADTTTGGGCTWCSCAAVPSACWQKSNAAKLPPGVYTCDSETVGGAKTTLFTLEQASATGDCGQVDIPVVDVKAAQTVDKNLKVGTCASAGYSMPDGKMEKKVPVLGLLTVDKFKKTLYMQ